jgi:hypothetical protein
MGAGIFGLDTATSPPSVTLPGPDQWFTDNFTSGVGSQVPDYWLNKQGAEIENAILDLAFALNVSVTYSPSTRNQLGSLLGLLRGNVQTGAGVVTAGSLAVTFAQAFPAGSVPKVVITDNNAATWSTANHSVYGLSGPATNTDFTVVAFQWNGAAYVPSVSSSFNYVASL